MYDKYRLGIIPVFLCIIMGLAAGCGLSQNAINAKAADSGKSSNSVKTTKAEEKDKPKPKPKKKAKKASRATNVQSLAGSISLEGEPIIPREMRGVWIATVNNIDWPSKPGLPVAKQKEELKQLLDRAKKLHLNTIFLQVRPSADALYQSKYEPWSYFLTGKQGLPPRPYYDPLQFAVKQAHKRGLELQAWFNPFRAYDPTAPEKFSSGSIINTHPSWIVKYGRNYWLNPGIKAVRDYSIKIILDVARRYNIDGVFLDDYFYPYTKWTAGRRAVPFPDLKNYHAYEKKYGVIKRGDWRRHNINRFVKQLHDSLRKVKPRLLFGISPFGIWRPGHPPKVKGYDAYARLFADSRKWFRKGWVDYLSPQLYWGIDQPGQRFPVLLKWWKSQNFHNRHLWPGLYTDKVGRGWNAKQIVRQIRITRRTTKSPGEVHFSMHALENSDSHIDAKLLKTVYSKPAIIPRSPWLSKQKPAQPDADLQKRERQFVITFRRSQEKRPFQWLIKVKYGSYWIVKIISGRKGQVTLPPNDEHGQLRGAVVYAVNRLGNKSPRKVLLPGRKLSVH
jgi:uncharacterized lipoprotein YddW (UPF0748 family)